MRSRAFVINLTRISIIILGTLTRITFASIGTVSTVASVSETVVNNLAMSRLPRNCIAVTSITAADFVGTCTAVFAWRETARVYGFTVVAGVPGLCVGVRGAVASVGDVVRAV